ncbi:MAG: rane-bound D-gluconate 2-dehydrogenase small subunit [Bryobacterales bacterium]|nr:rane-bound D-gluconate 2-dehydrogenase small subunit [Bryobacterales bacterium]
MIVRMNSKDVSRRALIQSAAFVPLAALTLSAQQVAQTALTPAQMKTLEAFIDRLIPSDDLGPGAVEAGAHIYIDRVLAGPNANEKDSFVQGLEAMDAYAKKTHGAALAELSAEKRDQVLTEMLNTQFFNRARRLTLEGMFSDPYYGGNKNFAGWDLIRYPGPRPAVAAEDQALNVEIKPYRVSAYGVKYGH